LPKYDKEKVLDARDNKGYAAIHYAAKLNRFKILTLLVTNGASKSPFIILKIIGESLIEDVVSVLNAVLFMFANKLSVEACFKLDMSWNVFGIMLYKFPLSH